MEIVSRQRLFWEKCIFQQENFLLLCCFDLKWKKFLFFFQKTFSLLSFLNLKITPSLFDLNINSLYISAVGSSQRTVAESTAYARKYSVGWAAIKKNPAQGSIQLHRRESGKKLNQTHWGKLLLLPLASWGLYFPLSPAMSSVSEVPLKRSERSNYTIGILSVRG